jgi:hypothetical protein
MTFLCIFSGNFIVNVAEFNRYQCCSQNIFRSPFFLPLTCRADLDPPTFPVQRLFLLAPFTFPSHYFIAPLARTHICSSTACIRLHVTCVGCPVLGSQFMISVGLFYGHRATVPVCAYTEVLDPASAGRCPPV